MTKQTDDQTNRIGLETRLNTYTNEPHSFYSFFSGGLGNPSTTAVVAVVILVVAAIIIVVFIVGALVYRQRQHKFKEYNVLVAMG